MSRGAQVFGYFPPSVLEVGPNERVNRVVSLTWPQSLDRLWNSCNEAAPNPGDYRVSIRIGYGLTPSPELPGLGEGVEAPVQRWQRLAVSKNVLMNVPEQNAFSAEPDRPA